MHSHNYHCSVPIYLSKHAAAVLIPLMTDSGLQFLGAFTCALDPIGQVALVAKITPSKEKLQLFLSSEDLLANYHLCFCYSREDYYNALYIVRGLWKKLHAIPRYHQFFFY